MMLKRKSSEPRGLWKVLRAGLAGLLAMGSAAALTAGCLDRPVAPATPKTNNVYVSEIRQSGVDKIDLLFMIDNSISMADKQAILAEAVPLLVQRLITPICIRDCAAGDNCSEAQQRDGIPVGGVFENGECPMGGKPEFEPIADIHVGVITSSLGSHGATGGGDVCTDPGDDDHARLLGALRPMPGVGQTWNGTGFLAWDPEGEKSPAGDSNGAMFSTKFTQMVTSAGEQGCGYEASLEAWYRFLIDPQPPELIEVASDNRAGPVRDEAGAIKVDQIVISQREAFLRADSLVAIVMLTDENDCSIVDEGYGYLISRDGRMFRSTSQCATNPNDPCCQSCGEEEANDGCPALSSDAECAKGKTFGQDTGEDDLNLRCWEQKRRFGFELLYPTSRYSSALREPLIRDRDGNEVLNPLFAPKGDKPARDRNLVFLAGLVGVPWQDIADEASLQSPDTLRYLTAEQIQAQGRWEMILGDPKASPPVLPTDPLMVETPVDRTTLAGINKNHPLVQGAALVASSSTDPRANVINGHEQANVGNRDLQYACTFPLPEPIECTEERDMSGAGCDCTAADEPYNRPLCQPPTGGPAGTTQYFAKAYPGIRHLQVLREFGLNSIVASICPKVLDTAEADYGYNPAVKAIIDRLKEALRGKCLPRALDYEEEGTDTREAGQVPCAVVEAVLPEAGGACSCNTGENRIPLDGSDGQEARPQLRDAVLATLEEGGSCVPELDDKGMGTLCESFCTCELAQLSGAALQECQNSETEPAVPGYCYINAAENEPQVGNPELVKECSDDSKRLLRFVGNTPAPGSIALVACLGASLGTAE
jgi:hypothetical protein